MSRFKHLLIDALAFLLGVTTIAFELASGLIVASSIGNSFYSAGSFDKAKELYREAFQIFERELLSAGKDTKKQKRKNLNKIKHLEQLFS